MKVLRINHLGLAPQKPDVTKSFFGDILGLPLQGEEQVDDQKVHVSFFSCGESRLESLTPTDAASPIAKFLEKKGSGIHHVALEVDNLSEWLQYLLSKGVELIDEHPRRGAHDTQIAFVHPRATGGILVELVQEKA